MKTLIKFAAVAAIVLPMMAACGGEKPTDPKNVLNGPEVSVGEVTNGKLVLESYLFANNEPLTVIVAYESNGQVYYWGGNESPIFTIGDVQEKEAKGLVDVKGKRYEFPVTVNPPLDNEDAESTLIFSVQYDANTVVEKASQLTIVRKGAEVNIPKGALPYKFTVGANRQAYFAKGNVEYDFILKQYYFAEKQWATSDADNMVARFPRYSDNSDIYGVDGFYITNSKNWNIVDVEENNPDDKYWQLLDPQDWDYLINRRQNAKALRGVFYGIEQAGGDIGGMVILPDDFEKLAKEKGWQSPIVGSNDPFTVSSFAELQELAEHGALILPGEGLLDSRKVYPGLTDEQYMAGNLPAYWTYDLSFDDNGGSSATAFILNDPYQNNGTVIAPNFVKIEGDYDPFLPIRLIYPAWY